MVLVFSYPGNHGRTASEMKRGNPECHLGILEREVEEGREDGDHGRCRLYEWPWEMGKSTGSLDVMDFHPYR